MTLDPKDAEDLMAAGFLEHCRCRPLRESIETMQRVARSTHFKVDTSALKCDECDGSGYVLVRRVRVLAEVCHDHIRRERAKTRAKERYEKEVPF